MPEARPVQKPPPQQQPRAAQANYKKIEAYAAHLLNEAVAKEKAERFGDAIVDYLQAADMLLLLAKGTRTTRHGRHSATRRSPASRG